MLVSLSFFKLRNRSFSLNDKWMNSVTHNSCIIQNVKKFQPLISHLGVTQSYSNAIARG